MWLVAGKNRSAFHSNGGRPSAVPGPAKAMTFFASALEDVTDDPLQSRLIGDGQIAFEDHAVIAREDSDDWLVNLASQRVSVLTAISSRSEHLQHYSGGRMLVLLILYGCGSGTFS